jgi:hypothetical protein
MLITTHTATAGDGAAGTRQLPLLVVCGCVGWGGGNLEQLWALLFLCLVQSSAAALLMRDMGLSARCMMPMRDMALSARCMMPMRDMGLSARCMMPML